MGRAGELDLLVDGHDWSWEWWLRFAGWGIRVGGGDERGAIAWIIEGGWNVVLYCTGLLDDGGS